MMHEHAEKAFCEQPQAASKNEKPNLDFVS